MLTLKRLIGALLFSCALALILSGLFFLSERSKEKESNREIILVATNLGTETITHADFVNKLIRNTKLHQKTTVRIFLGPYISLLGFGGLLISDPPNYYIFIDIHVYFLLNQNEIEALIAHEIGHMFYERDFVDKLQLDILYKLNIFSRRRNEILTKYQVRADRFSTENTSSAIMLSLLNKLYLTNKESSDYKIRIESLNKLKQGH